MQTFKYRIQISAFALFWMLTLSSCGTSHYSIKGDSLPEEGNGIVVTRLIFFDSERKPVDPFSWWRYALYPVYGPLTVDVYIDNKLTDIKMDEQGYIIFQHPPAILPRNPRYRLRLSRPFLFNYMETSIFFTKTPEPASVKSQEIAVLPVFAVNMSSGHSTGDASYESQLKTLEYLCSSYPKIYSAFFKGATK